jgi:FlaA1/EpsC-like NDP-sugar epimerase
MSETLGSAVSMINYYLDDYEGKGYLFREYKSSKIVQYIITKKGVERKKLLNIWYLMDSQIIYRNAKDNIINYLRTLSEKGYNSVLLYGAGEVANIIIDVIKDNNFLSEFIVIAVIDDDFNKIGTQIGGKPVIELSEVFSYEFDGILISSFTANTIIYNNLLNNGFVPSKIIRFFE